MIDLNSFKNNCLKNKCARISIPSKKCLGEAKQKKCYDKYVKRSTRVYEVDEEWAAVVTFIKKRDKNQCRLMQVLSSEELSKVLLDIVKNFGSYKEPLDPAHIFRRSIRKDLYYEPSNIVLLHRYFHSRLDTYKDPITNKSIGKEEVGKWWKRIIGEDLYNYLRGSKHED